MLFHVPIRAACFSLLLSLGFVADLSGQRYTFLQYGSQDGLSNFSVHCMVQDRQGYIWAGTDNGLFRYDGDRFRAFGHSDGLTQTEITAMAESPQGALWLATPAGVMRQTGTRFVDVDVGEQGTFRGIGFDRSGRVMLQNNSGLVEGEPDAEGTYRFRTVVRGSMRGLFVSGDDVFFGKDGELWQLKGIRAARVDSPGLPIDRWDAVSEDSLGNLWVRSMTRLYERSRNTQRFENRSLGVPNAPEPALYADPHGRVYVSSDAGVLILDGMKRTTIDTDHGLPMEGVGPVLVDRQESLWLGTRGGGVVRRRGQEWVSWIKADGLPQDTVWAVRPDRTGRVWVGTDQGVGLIGSDDRVRRRWTVRDGLAGDRVTAIALGPGGDAYVTTNPLGLSHISRQGGLRETWKSESGLAGNYLYALAIDRQLRLWVGGDKGCFRSRDPVANGGRLAFDPVDIPGFGDATVVRDVLVDSKGVVWLATSRGLARFDGTSWRVFTVSDGLKRADLEAVAEGQGAIWISYRDSMGMTRLQIERKGLKLTHFTDQDGLSSSEVVGLEFDTSGGLWAATDSGVDVLRDGHWQHYGKEDGLIWDDADSRALGAGPDGTMWIGTSGGLSRYTPSPSSPPALPAPVVLSSIRGDAQSYEPTDQPTLPYAQRSLAFQFSALDYSGQSRIRFRYRLEGSDDSWKETRERSVRFAGLPGGHYVFEVMAAGANGLWSKTPARFAFSIKPLWWQTWWFITLGVLAALTLAIAAWRLRVRALLTQKELLERQVAERTAELLLSHRQLEELAYHDVLTGLPNRRMFTEQLNQRLAIARRRHEAFGLLLIDLDSFKCINDEFGHDAGDAVLIETSKRLRGALRESDCAARLGGDEFGILLDSTYGRAGIEAVCRRITDSFVARIPFKDMELEVRCSIGVAIFAEDGSNQEDLYKSADLALYQSKRARQNAQGLDLPQSNNGIQSARAILQQAVGAVPDQGSSVEGSWVNNTLTARGSGCAG